MSLPTSLIEHARRRRSTAGGPPRRDWRQLRASVRIAMPALLFGGASLITLPGSALADSAADDLNQLRASVQKEIATLKKQEAKLHQQVLELDRKSQILDRKSQILDRKNQLLDRQLREIRATGLETVSPVPSNVATSAPPTSGSGLEVAQAPASQTTTPASSAPGAAPAAPQGGAAAPAASSANGQSAPIAGPSAAQQQARQVVETAPSLSNSGGVLTPKGQIIIDPSVEYDYWSQNQLGVNGFQIIPGITFGNIFANRVEQNITTAALTARYGITDRLEINVKIPYVYNTGNTISLIPEGTSAQLLNVNATGMGIGDMQFGTSYQFNSGENGWPILVGNLLFKTATGISPFDVPIVTLNEPNGEFLEGQPKKLATGTGFFAAEPSLTVLVPTAPGVLFANIQDIHNFGSTVHIQSVQGGPPTAAFLQPGENPAITFGIGFALNDRAALTFSYQQEHVFTAFENHQAIAGSPYSFGTFNFGLGYQISQSTRVNLSVGIGAGQNAPVAKVLLEVPYRFSL